MNGSLVIIKYDEKDDESNSTDEQVEIETKTKTKTKRKNRIKIKKEDEGNILFRIEYQNLKDDFLEIEEGQTKEYFLKDIGRQLEKLMPYISNVYVKNKRKITCRNCDAMIKIESYDVKTKTTKILVGGHSCEKKFNKIPGFVTDAVDKLLILFSVDEKEPNYIRKQVIRTVKATPMYAFVGNSDAFTKHVNNRYIRLQKMYDLEEIRRTSKREAPTVDEGQQRKTKKMGKKMRKE